MLYKNITGFTWRGYVWKWKRPYLQASMFWYYG